MANATFGSACVCNTVCNNTVCNNTGEEERGGQAEGQLSRNWLVSVDEYEAKKNPGQL